MTTSERRSAVVVAVVVALVGAVAFALLAWWLVPWDPVGRPVEGLTLLPGWESFVGAGPMPMRHGLTMGELGDWFVDLLKLDIEGAEWPILADSRFAGLRVPVVMLEHHNEGAPAGATPEESAERALTDAGYDVERTVVEFPGAGVVWGVLRS